MRGNILDYSVDEDVGVISGPDGVRFKFKLADWKHKCPVISGVNVDYVVEAGMATEIYCTDKEALDSYVEKIRAENFSENSKLEAARNKNELENELSKINAITQNYQDNYVSSDMAWWKGVIAGSCHKAGAPVYIGRAVAVSILLSPIYLLIRDGSSPAIFMGVVNFLCIYGYLASAKKFRAIPTGDSMAEEYTRYIKLKNKSDMPNTLNKIGSFVSVMAGKGPNGEFSKNQVSTSLREPQPQPQPQRVLSNVMACSHCGASTSVSSQSNSLTCPSCQKTTFVFYRDDGTIQRTI